MSNQRFWEKPVAALRRRVCQGHRTSGREKNFNNALGGLDGADSASHPDARGIFHVSPFDTKDATNRKLRLM